MPRHSATCVVPPGALVCCFTDGLVERRDALIDHNIGTLASVLLDLPAGGAGPGPLAEQACAAVRRALAGNTSSTDDIAVLMLGRHAG